MRGRKVMEGVVPYIIAMNRKKGVVYEARLRGSKDVRFTVGVYPDRETALAACEASIASGEYLTKGEARRGPKKGCRMFTKQISPTSQRANLPPKCSEQVSTCSNPATDRIDMMKRVLRRFA